MIRKLLALAVIPLILLAVARGAESLTLYSWNQVVKYQSPYLSQLPFGQPSERVTSQVIVFVADGLRLDTSREMPTLNKLRQQGADLVALTGEPSLSLPSWTVIVSGGYQEVSGVTTNWYEGAARIDSIFAEAKRQGLTTAVAGSASWSQLFGPWIDRSELPKEPEQYGDMAAIRQHDAQVMTTALGLLRQSKPNLMLIHLSGPDYAGHSFGGASQEYRNEAQVTDGHLASLLESIDLSQTTLVFTADHGQIDTGGHGGWESVVKQTPLVIAGKGIKGAGSVKQVGQADIAPTVATLLGTPIPVHSQGRALLEIVDEPAVAKGQHGLAVARQLAVLGDAMASKLGGKPFAQARLAAAQAGIGNGDPNALADFQDQLAREVQSARDGKMNGERLLRFPLALLVVGLPIVHIWRTPRKRDFLVPLVGAATYFALYNALFFVRGYQWSLSVFNHEELLASFFKQRGMEALGAVVAATILVGILSRRRSALDTAWAVINTSFLIAYLLVIQIAVFYVLYGFSYSWYIPDLQIGFKSYLDLVQLVSTVWPMLYLPVVIVLPPLGIGVKFLASWILARRQPQPEPAAPVR